MHSLTFGLPYPVVLVISCAVFGVVWFAFQQLGARHWPAFFITAACFLATAAVVQWLYW